MKYDFFIFEITFCLYFLENTIMKGQFSCRLLKSCLVVTIVTTAMLIFLEMIAVHNVSLMDYTIISIKSENNYQNTSVIEWRELWKNKVY